MQVICHNLEQNPCAVSDGNDGCGHNLDIKWNKTCLATTPCTSALHERLFSISELGLVGLTGPFQYEDDTKDRVLNYEVPPLVVHGFPRGR